MKKLMIATAAVALAAVAQAGIVVTNCSTGVSSDCPQIVFKVTASGKATDAYTKEYTSIGKLSIKKGALVMWAGSDSNGDNCCYDQYSLYANVKIGKNTYNVLVPQTPIDSWTLFGKNQDAAYEALTSADKSKKYKLDSQLGISALVRDGDNILDADVADLDEDFEDTAFIATAFGKGTISAKYKKGCDKCSPGSSSAEIVPGNYSGWFAGLFKGANADLCFDCICREINVFGGTWKAKYDKNKTTWTAAADYVFGSAIRANMFDEGIE